MSNSEERVGGSNHHAGLETKVQAIRNTISSAKLHEQNTQALASLLSVQLQNLHSAIRMPNDNPVERLVNFSISYIDHAPEFLQSANTLLDEVGIGDYGGPIFAMAADYFFHPPSPVKENNGLKALLDQSYLAHRIVEEVNDRFLLEVGIPLVPLDMTRSNLVVYSLIDSPLADELDQVLLNTVDELLPFGSIQRDPRLKVYVEKHSANQWQQLAMRWPCLSQLHDIEVSFSGSTTANKDTH